MNYCHLLEYFLEYKEIEVLYALTVQCDEQVGIPCCERMVALVGLGDLALSGVMKSPGNLELSQNTEAFRGSHMFPENVPGWVAQPDGDSGRAPCVVLKLVMDSMKAASLCYMHMVCDATTMLY